MRVFLDSAPENAELYLDAIRLAGTWSGFVVPVVTADEFRRFIGAWQRNDPDGQWNAEGVMVVWAEFVFATVSTLMYADGESEPESWPQVDVDDAGNPLYEISGWMWSVEDDAETLGLDNYASYHESDES